MGGFLRLKVLAKDVSDDDFVRAVREGLGAGRPLRPGRVVGNYIALTGILLAIVELLWLWHYSPAGAGRVGCVRAAAVLGVILGIGTGMIILYGLKVAADAARDRREERMARLLLKYHDAAGGESRAPVR